MTGRLDQIAYARSGDKGAGANIGVIARTPAGYEFLRQVLTAEKVGGFFAKLGPTSCVRYELPDLLALNFVLTEILDGGGSVSLRNDAQGKSLAQLLLGMEIELPESLPGDADA